MIILTTSTEIQEFKVVPRYFPETVTLKITDDYLNTSVEYPYTSSFCYGSMIVSQSFELLEDHFYKLEIFDGVKNVYRGRIYCTNQPEYDKFDITSGSIETSDDVDDIILI